MNTDQKSVPFSHPLTPPTSQFASPFILHNSSLILPHATPAQHAFSNGCWQEFGRKGEAGGMAKIPATANLEDRAVAGFIH